MGRGHVSEPVGATESVWQVGSSSMFIFNNSWRNFIVGKNSFFVLIQESSCMNENRPVTLKMNGIALGPVHSSPFILLS